MTYTTYAQTYRIALDTTHQLFMAIDIHDEARVGYGATIEQAVAELKKSY
ncbi:hypothetical protein [Enterococcus canis]|nr:hypothetical protein [Enterococcus canis]